MSKNKRHTFFLRSSIDEQDPRKRDTHVLYKSVSVQTSRKRNSIFAHELETMKRVFFHGTSGRFRSKTMATGRTGRTNRCYDRFKNRAPLLVPGTTINLSFFNENFKLNDQNGISFRRAREIPPRCPSLDHFIASASVP